MLVSFICFLILILQVYIVLKISSWLKYFCNNTARIICSMCVFKYLIIYTSKAYKVTFACEGEHWKMSEELISMRTMFDFIHPKKLIFHHAVYRYLWTLPYISKKIHFSNYFFSYNCYPGPSRACRSLKSLPTYLKF